MDDSKIKDIFRNNNLGEALSINKSKIGWTNEVYSVNNKFILKICGKGNQKNFEKEVFLYKIFKNKLPVPNILVYDNSKKICNKPYIIYTKIQGDNLYSIWHLMSNNERKEIIRQLCSSLRTINEEVGAFANEFGFKTNLNWHDKIISKINKNLKKVDKMGLISKEFIAAIKKFIDKNHEALYEQKIGLVYWDAHFDNILVKNNQIVGILDFERTELASIDFGLDIIKRMMDYPKKYMSEEFEKCGRKKDYIYLLVWFKKFYPELFNFENLNKRLALYSIEHDLDTLLGWPKSKTVKKMIAKSIGFKHEI